jgi:hypothetical protein
VRFHLSCRFLERRKIDLCAGVGGCCCEHFFVTRVKVSDGGCVHVARPLGLESVSSKQEACLGLPLTAACITLGCVTVASQLMTIGVEVEKTTRVVFPATAAGSPCCACEELL